MSECVAVFRASPAAKPRSRAVPGAAAACALAVLVSLVADRPRVAAGFLGPGLMTALAYFVVTGLTVLDQHRPGPPRLAVPGRRRGTLAFAGWFAREARVTIVVRCRAGNEVGTGGYHDQ